MASIQPDFSTYSPLKNLVDLVQLVLEENRVSAIGGTLMHGLMELTSTEQQPAVLLRTKWFVC